MNILSKIIISIGFLSLMVFNVHARNQIRIVGSSTVFPFSTSVAENFGRTSAFKTPVVEATGSGGGLKLFCGGIGDNYPDIANASRRIKPSEVKKCNSKNITPIEVKIGFDGIVLANSVKSRQIDLSVGEIFLALGKVVVIDGVLVDNPYTHWNQINTNLPNTKIEVLGPPPTSGTRDAFVELAMEAGAKQNADLKKLHDLTDHTQIKQLMTKLNIPQSVFIQLHRIKDAKLSGKDIFKAVAHSIREDGLFVAAGENDNLIVQKLNANTNAFGMFGFSFLEENSDSVHGSLVNGYQPSFENISSGKYPISRSLYFYVKKEHLSLVPGISEFVAEFTDEYTWGDEGYLVDKGLIPLPEEQRAEIISRLNQQLR